MINRPPQNWEYNESLEMMFLFYQCTDELLSEITPDTYSLPLHNALTLISELDEVLSLLEQYNVTETYYDKYIPPIIDEFIQKTEEDYILKRILGNRLSSIRTGFGEAKKQKRVLSQWLDLFKQTCTPLSYNRAYKEEIIKLTKDTSEKRKLIYCIQNYYISLRSAGYSREYLYTTAKRFFSNTSNPIKDVSQLRDFLNTFTFTNQTFEYLILMDLDAVEYIEGISERVKVIKQIQKVDVENERKQLCKDHQVAELFIEYDRKVHNAGKHNKVAIVRYSGTGVDPFTVAEQFSEQIRFLNTFKMYFKHFYSSQHIYLTLQKNEHGYYHRINLPNKLQKRPFLSQDIIDTRIKNILNAKSMGIDAFTSIANAIDMHAEAYDARNTSTLLRLFWTALETLFSTPDSNHPRENVINSIIPIIQKTYILKLLRTVHSQIIDAIDEDKVKRLGIYFFKEFVEYFACNKEDSQAMKLVFSELNCNPLLRTRLYLLRKSLKDGPSINSLLEEHENRVAWQLQRIYRIRNVATHLGQSISGLETVINHLHNYFDYAVNYILCKSENGDFVVSSSAVVFESKNDNRIQKELLKGSGEINGNNYLQLLFGPDERIMNYYFQ